MYLATSAFMYLVEYIFIYGGIYMYISFFTCLTAMAKVIAEKNSHYFILKFSDYHVLFESDLGLTNWNHLLQTLEQLLKQRKKED